MKRKNFFISAAAALAILIGGGIAPAALAQTSVGYWNIFPQYSGTNVTNVVDTGKKMYYLSMSRLNSYDLENQESYSYNSDNKLTDNNITKIFYFPEIQSLLLAYDTGNLDLLDVNTDRVVNMGDIADANITYNKTINDAFYYKGRIYVATAFGIVVFDAKQHYVIESGMYGKVINTVFAAGDNLYIVEKTENTMRWAPLAERHNSFDKFTLFNQWTIAQATVPFGTGVLQISDNSKIKVYIPRTADQENAAFNFNCTETDIVPVQPLQCNTDGTVTAITATDIVTFSPEADADSKYISRSVTIPATVKGNKLGTHDGGKTLWSFASKGVSLYTIADDGSLTVNIDNMQLEAISMTSLFHMQGSQDGDKVYIVPHSWSINYPSGTTGAYGPVEYTMIERDGKIHHVSAPAWTDGSTRFQPMGLAVDPKNPNRIVIPTLQQNVLVFLNGELEGEFSRTNSPLPNCWTGTGGDGGASSNCATFDKDGNLWIGAARVNAVNTDFAIYHMLPRKYLDAGIDKVTKENWQSETKDIGKYPYRYTAARCIITTTGKKNILISLEENGNHNLHVYDTNGTLDDTSDDIFYDIPNGFIDQDGKAFAPVYKICAVEDTKRGCVWMGTDKGVVEITDPSKLGSADFRITRLKVPRNDGTNYADYLLESERVNYIAVDPSNRKWIATENSGVYLVSEKGDKIIEHFTADNSPLPTNTIHSIWCNPSNNLVYFGTAQGLVSYSSNSAPAAPDFSDVYAYPNPVRPDFTGWITVKGLKDNSLVKIADTAGNVFHQTRSEGGMIVWDGCGPDGQRVPSGVYFVFASTGDESQEKAGAVTKIMIIR